MSLDLGAIVVESSFDYACIYGDGLLATVVAIIVTPHTIHNDLELFERCEGCILDLRSVDDNHNYTVQMSNLQCCQTVCIREI